jgi:catechol 2,3-dioxygenase-like lactoylglutathione lyase family enzyme
MILALHHIQLAMPKGAEAQARGFYAETLGLTEVEKPEPLRARGGVWFESGSVRLHLGVEDPFFPAKKAHPAFQVTSLTAAIAALEAAELPWRRDVDLPGLKRVYTEDPFGNRIELLELT